MTNAGTAKKWLLDYYKGDATSVAKHFAARKFFDYFVFIFCCKYKRITHLTSLVMYFF